MHDNGDNQPSVEPCTNRVQLEPDLFFCRHPRVHAEQHGNLVQLHVECKDCRFRDKPCKPCRPMPVEPPSLLRKLLNVTVAVVKHAASGFKQREPAEIERIQAICHACEWWKAGACQHKLCGCSTRRKTPWATERCPVGKW